METILTKFEVKEISWPDKTFITRRAQLPLDKLPSFFSETYGAIYQALGKAGILTNEPPCAIYYSIDQVKMVTDVAAAVPVKDLVNDLTGFEKVLIPKSKALLVTYFGSYENMATAYEVIDKYVADHKLEKGWMLEEYFSDPAVEKDPAKWKTNIYCVLK